MPTQGSLVKLGNDILLATVEGNPRQTVEEMIIVTVKDTIYSNVSHH